MRFPVIAIGPDPWTGAEAVALSYKRDDAQRCVERLFGLHVGKLESLGSKLRSQAHQDFATRSESLIKAFHSSILTGQVELNVRYKHHGYEEEQESRLFECRPAHTPRGDVGPIRYRSARGMPIPYVDFRGGKAADCKSLPSREIVVGPALDYVRARHNLVLALQRYGYPDDVEIKSSEKRYRQ